MTTSTLFLTVELCNFVTLSSIDDDILAKDTGADQQTAAIKPTKHKTETKYFPVFIAIEAAVNEIAEQTARTMIVITGPVLPNPTYSTFK